MKCALVIAFVFIACVNGADVRSKEEAERLFREKCLKNSDQEAYNEAKDAREKVQKCIMSQFTTLKDEFAQATSITDLNKVFKEYCRKTPEFRSCVTDFTTSVEPCLDKAEREIIDIVHNVTDALLEFICYEEGSGITKFFVEGGTKCIKSNHVDILKCVTTTFGDQATNKMTSSKKNLLMAFTENCSNIRRVQTCIVKKVASCPEKALGKTVDEMFYYVFKDTPCDKYKGSGSAPTAALTSLIAIVVTRFL